MKPTSLELALNFLSNRNPFDDVCHSDYVFSLMNFQDKKGDDAIKGLAGFYLYAIRKIGGQKGSEAIATTFAHDLNGANEKFCEPKSSGYIHVWNEEVETYVQTEASNKNI